MPSSTAKQIDFLMSGVTDKNGNQVSGGKIFTFDAGTNKPRDTWIDADQNTLAPNPVILDSRGTSLTFALGDYKFIIKDSDDTVLYTRDFEFYGSQGVGQFYIADENGPGGSGFPDPGELVTSDGTDLGGGAGGGGSGAQVTDDGSVNNPPIPCGDGAPCHCGCCNPDAYRVTLGGQTGLFEGLNGVWIVSRVGGGIGLYRRTTEFGIITLDLNEITCNKLNIVAGDLIDTSTISNTSTCTDSGSVGSLTWAICPFGTGISVSTIEVTFFGVVACSGCGEGTADNLSFDNISVSLGTFSLTGVCSWGFQDSGVIRFIGDFHTGTGCVTPIPDNSNPHSIDIDVNVSGSIVSVSVIGNGGVLPKIRNAEIFRGTGSLVAGEDHCGSLLAISNTIECGTNGANVFASGGFANINWRP